VTFKAVYGAWREILGGRWAGPRRPRVISTDRNFSLGPAFFSKFTGIARHVARDVKLKIRPWEAVVPRVSPDRGGPRRRR